MTKDNEQFEDRDYMAVSAPGCHGQAEWAAPIHAEGLDWESAVRMAQQDNALAVVRNGYRGEVLYAAPMDGARDGRATGAGATIPSPPKRAG